MARPKAVIEERYIRRNTAEPFYLSVSKELVAGHERIHKFGANFQIDSNTDPETIWTGEDYILGHLLILHKFYMAYRQVLQIQKK